MLVYARNLVALESLSESPGLWQLLTAASSCLGNEYASRVATLALDDHFNPEAEHFPLLIHQIEKDKDLRYVRVFRCEGKVLAGEPMFGQAGWTLRPLPSSIEIKRRGRNQPAAEVKPAQHKKKTSWVAYPDDELAYEAFVRYVLDHLATTGSDSMTSVRFVSSIGEGVDIRETIRHWHEGDIYVKEPERQPMRVRNGLRLY
jgi:hypothetical protein